MIIISEAVNMKIEIDNLDKLEYRALMKEEREFQKNENSKWFRKNIRSFRNVQN